MQCYSELVPPTAVSHALSIRFLELSSTNLVVAKTSVLQIYKIRSIHSQNASGTGISDNHSRLEIVGEYTLSGTVTSLAKVKAADTKSGAEALLVSFRDAKISLLEWDPENHRISTVSIHYYEDGKVPLAPFEPPLSDCDSKLIVDPRSRCAALRFATRHLAILPFRQDDEDLAAIEDDISGDRNHGVEVVTDGENTKPGERTVTPYAPSFVLALTALDPALTHPVDVTFLYEYREPTFGIVFASRAASAALLDERRDPLSYNVITLDLEQKASTTLLSVKGLPYDIWNVIPLPSPVGGSLLVGVNILVHVDQSGKTNAVGVNEFARQCSDMSIADQSFLNMRLENSCIDILNADTGDMLIVLDTGRLAILTFRIDGRNVSGMSVHLVDDEHCGDLATPGVAALVSLPNRQLFAGSEGGDSKLFSWSGQVAALARKRSHAQMLGEDMGFEIDEADLEDDGDADDDLYGEETLTKSSMQRQNRAVAPGSYVFSQLDSLPTLAPINSLVIGRAPSEGLIKSTSPPLELIVSVGQETASKLVRISKDISLRAVREEAESKVQAAFFFKMVSDSGTREYVAMSEVDDNGKEISKLLLVNQEPEKGAWTEVTDTDFERDGRTSEMHVLRDSQRVLHVRESEVRSYDQDFGLSQIVPVLDAATDEELQVLHSSFSEPYLVLLRGDSTVQLFKADASGELEEVEGGDAFQRGKWISACLYQSQDQFEGASLCFLLSGTGTLQIFELPNIKEPIFTAPNLGALPPVLTIEDRQRRAGSRETLTEILFADIGTEQVKSPYLVVRNSLDALTLYEPFFSKTDGPPKSPSSCEGLRFRKVSGLHVPRGDDSANPVRAAPMKALSNVGGYSAVAISGASPSLVMKTAATLARVVDVKGLPVKFISGFDSAWCPSGLVYGDTSSTLRLAVLPQDISFNTAGCITKSIFPLPPDQQLHDLAYHADRELYVLISSTAIEFHPAEEDPSDHSFDGNLLLRPETRVYHVHLLDPKSHRIVSSHTLPQYELVTSLHVSACETSEITHEKSLLISVGTTTQRADAYADKGGLYVFSIISVVPVPERPETSSALRLVSHEETKAPITALTGLGGLIGTAQGQKLMWRGLREDGQCLPVAFLDFLTYTTSLKTLAGTTAPLWLAGDARKGVWLGGYTFEPPRMHVFGKSTPRLGVVCVEFLPGREGELQVLAADERGRVWSWTYEPEDPKSAGGMRLVEGGSWVAGGLVTGMKLLPAHLPGSAAAVGGRGEGGGGGGGGGGGDGEAAGKDKVWQVLTWSRQGGLGLVTPLTEAQYRRLSALQSQLSTLLEHPAGLNPRAYRNVRAGGEEGGGGGGGGAGARASGRAAVVDGDLIGGVAELGAGRRAEVVGRVADWWEISADLELVGGKGLDYL